jgi:hypothetical protein
VLVLVVLLQPLVPLFDYLISSSLELYRLVCNGHNFPLIGKVAYTKYTIREEYVFRKYINTWETCAGGLVFIGLLQPLVPIFVHRYALDL